MKHCLRYKISLLAMVLATTGTQTFAHPGLQHEIETVSAKVKQAPYNVDLLIERGRLYRLDDNPSASLVDLEQAYAVDANNGRINLELGLTLSALGRDTQAEDHLNRYIARGDAIPAAYAERARIRARTNRLESAIDDFSKTVERNGDLDHYLARGRLQESLGWLDEAAAGYREGLERTRGAVALRLVLIRTEVARARYDAALALIDQVASQARVRTQWYLRRAHVLDAAGHSDRASRERYRALTEADRALARRATAINLVARARIYLELGRIAAARDDLCAAIRKAPRYTAAEGLLSDIEGQCGDTARDQR